VRALVLCPDRCQALEQGNRGRLDRYAKGLVTKQERTRCWRGMCKALEGSRNRKAKQARGLLFTIVSVSYEEGKETR
jgi:hypothetical protein